MKPAVAVHRLIRRTHQKNRVVGRSEVTGLSLAESHLLIEIAGAPRRGVTELSTVLMLSQGFTSQLVQGLLKRGLLAAEIAGRDARRKGLVLTAAGESIVALTDAAANDRYRDMVRHLRREEEQAIIWLFKCVADGMGVPSSVRRSDEPVYRAEQRRITRGCGFLSESMFSCQISSTMWQVLGEVVLSPVPPQAGELAELLSLASNSLSSIVSQMERKEYISRSSNQRDGRGVVLRPLAAGRRAYQRVEATAARQIEIALKDSAAEKVTRAVNAMRRFVNDDATGLPPLHRNNSVVRVNREEDRKLARGLIARTLVRENYERELPEELVSRKRACFLLREEEQVIAALEADLAFARINSCGWLPSVTPWNMAAFIAATLIQEGADVDHFNKYVESFLPLRAFLKP